MRREFATMAVALTAYACALVLGSLIICAGAYASAIEGEWATQGNAAHASIERCSAALDSHCGRSPGFGNPCQRRVDIRASSFSIRLTNPDEWAKCRPPAELKWM